MSFQWTVVAPQRLDSFLADQNPEISRSRVQKVIERGEIEVNGEEVTKTAQKLKAGDIVFFDGEWDQRDVPTSIDPADLQLSVLYEDDDCLVIDKPSGISVHPGAGMGPDGKTILHGVAFLFGNRSIPFSESAVLVHRLDKETTGCLLIAKSPRAHQLLQEQFEKRDVRKTYLAIVAGVPAHATAVIDAPIGRSLTDRTKMAVITTASSREARTTYRTLDATADAALLECELHTGRTHQVRVHLSSIGHPLLGDPTYASIRSRELSAKYQPERLCLHAWKLRFLSPTQLKEIAVMAELPKSFTDVLERIGLKM